MISERSRPRCRPRAVAPASRGVSPTPRYSSPLCHCFHLATLHLGTRPDKEPEAKQIITSCSPVNARTGCTGRLSHVFHLYTLLHPGTKPTEESKYFCFANCRVAAWARTQQYGAYDCIRRDQHPVCPTYITVIKRRLQVRDEPCKFEVYVFCIF